jgi:hypothetical protein
MSYKDICKLEWVWMVGHALYFRSRDILYFMFWPFRYAVHLHLQTGLGLLLMLERCWKLLSAAMCFLRICFLYLGGTIVPHT